MDKIEDDEVDLIITSPPYPMIEMWDDLFSSINSNIRNALELKDDKKAYSLMHQELDKVWKECARVVNPGGIICINIGDATRKLDKTFQLYPNHARIIDFFQNHNFISLPCILWRKPTNSPTKFLGSGMIPPNAYVTLEHEYILIFRKSEKKRKFPSKYGKRYNSAFFWEERNKWFSDVWMDIRGISQYIYNQKNSNNLRERSAAFPLELPFRLINMFSLYGDTILDPFWGTGTTTLAGMITARNTVGYELNSHFREVFEKTFKKIEKVTNSMILRRIEEHVKFIKKYIKKGKKPKYRSNNYNFPVITKQEKDISFYKIKEIKKENNTYNLRYSEFDFESDLPREKKMIQSRLLT
ncbi:MAG: site-specific DNA-methyltransferase [Promethearchaeia archaeon]